MMIKTFEKFNSGFTFDEILQDLKDEFTTQFYFNPINGSMEKRFDNLDEWHSKMDGKYSDSTGIYYTLYFRCSNQKDYKIAHPILIEIVDRMNEKHLYPQKIYFELPRTAFGTAPARQYYELPDSDDESIPEKFTGIRFYFTNIEKHTQTFYQRFQRLGNNKYRDIHHGSLEED